MKLKKAIPINIHSLGKVRIHTIGSAQVLESSCTAAKILHPLKETAMRVLACERRLDALME